MSEDNINSKSPATSSESNKRRRSIDKASEDADLGAPMEKTQHESSEDSKRTYAGMYVPKELTESSSGKDSDNTLPRDDIDVIIENVKKSLNRGHPTTSKSRRDCCSLRTSLLKSQILILSLMIELFSNPRHYRISPTRL